MRTTIAKTTRAAIAGAMLLGCLAATSPAQGARPGDVLVASSTNGSAILAITPGSNVVSTIATFPAAIRGVVVAADNTKTRRPG